jgi:cytochrome c553
LVLVSIPLAIIGIKKDKKVFLVLSVLILLYVYGIAETKSLTFSKPDMSGIIINVEDNNYEIMEHGKAIYLQHCMRCHGKEGNKMHNNSPDLTKSELSEEERWNVIKKGKGIMPAFGPNLDKNEKEALEAFLNSIVAN